MRRIWQFCLLGGLLMFEVILDEWMSWDEKGLCMLYMALHTVFAKCLFILSVAFT